MDTFSVLLFIILALHIVVQNEWNRRIRKEIQQLKTRLGLFEPIK